MQRRPAPPDSYPAPLSRFETPAAFGSRALGSELTPSDSQLAPEIHSELVEEQETTQNLGDRRKRLTFDSLSRVAGFLL